MADNLRDLRRRRRSLQNTEQITQAMKMVSAAKLRRAQEAAQASRPYGEALAAMLQAVAARAQHVDHPLLKVRPVRRTAYVVLTSDRGLAGPYNAAILRLAAAEIGPARDEALILAAGRKGRDYFRRRGYRIAAEYTPVGDEARVAQAKAIAADVMRLYAEEEVDRVLLVYSQFVSVVTQRPTVQTLLPLSPPQRDRPVGAQYEFEPSAEAVLTALVPYYVETLIFRALQEARAAEHGARMTAMDSASRNAQELIRQITLQINRVRQALITKEIAEIVGGASALE